MTQEIGVYFVVPILSKRRQKCVVRAGLFGLAGSSEGRAWLARRVHWRSREHRWADRVGSARDVPAR